MAKASIRSYGTILYALTALSAALYLFFVLSAPIATSSEALRAYSIKIKFVRLALGFGYFVFWFCGAYSLTKLGRYITFLKDHSETEGFKKIYWGLAILTTGLVLWPPISASRATVLGNPELVRTLTFAFNYMMILPGLVGFYLINKGSQNLLGSVGIKEKISISVVPPLMGLLATLPVYLHLIFTNAQRTVSSKGVPATFYLPDYLILLTIVLPALASWAIGILAVLKLKAFKELAPGVIYRHALPPFYYGLAAVIMGSLLLQGIVSLGTNRLLALGPVPLVLTVYIFAGMLAVGYFLIASGTKRLTRIETVE